MGLRAIELPTINAIWIGPKLGPIHAACLRSFVQVGHKTVLHAYEPPSDVPNGVELADARALMPESRIVRYDKSGSYALFANLFRYQLLRAGLGLYVDCDMYCVRPIQNADYIFGWQDEWTICNAVLKLPPDSPILAKLCNLKDGFIPPWIGRRETLKMRLREIIGGPRRLGQMGWGTTGPKAVTWYTKQDGIASYATPTDVFYPIAKTHIHLLLDPDLHLDELITPRTQAVHLWNQLFVKRANKLSNLQSLVPRDLDDVPPTSPLGRILAG